VQLGTLVKIIPLTAVHLEQEESCTLFIAINLAEENFIVARVLRTTGVAVNFAKGNFSWCCT
jgi:hypothetical protein